MRRLVIIGASGFGREIAWIIKRKNAVFPQFELLGFSDDPLTSSRACAAPIRCSAVSKRRRGVVRNSSSARSASQSGAAGGVTDRAVAVGASPVTVIDPSAIVAPDAVIGDGGYIGSAVWCRPERV
jgi:UDP-3-O-[3-hydroxymyristoyl] glucosamine N-acyltransferase